MKNKRRHAQAANLQLKKFRRDSLDDDPDVELGNISSDSGSEEDYFKDDQKFQLEDNVEEVLPITNDDDDEDSDVEEDIHEERDSNDEGSFEDYGNDEALGPYSSTSEEEENDGRLEAWGNKKRNFFSADFVDEDRGRSYREEDRQVAKDEEDAALALHRNFVNDVYTSSSCFILDKEFLRDGEPVKDDNLDLAYSDWKATDKLHVFRKQSPEFNSIIHSFRDKLLDLKNRILPLVQHLKKMNATDEPYTKYITLKTQLLLNYCMNASFYMTSKSLGVPMARHPIIKTLDRYNKLLNRIRVLDVKLNPLIDEMLKNFEQSDSFSQGLSSIFSRKEEATPAVSEKCVSESLIMENGKSAKKTKDKKEVHFETKAEKEVLYSYMKMKEQERKASDELEEDEVEEEDNEDDSLNIKRSISYQIAKNKGLIPHRKKEYRNPRVRHRMKFKKAQIRRKGQVRLPRKELKKYGGEISGISAHVTKSVKIK